MSCCCSFLCSPLLCGQARCPRIPFAADVTVLVLRQVHVWVTQGPEGPAVRAPLQRDLLWLRLFWSPSLLLWEEKMFAAGVRSLGSRRNKLVQARLIPAVLTSVSASSVFSSDPPLCPVFSLQLSAFLTLPLLTKAQWASRKVYHVGRCPNRTWDVSLS